MTRWALTSTTSRPRSCPPRRERSPASAPHLPRRPRRSAGTSSDSRSRTTPRRSRSCATPRARSSSTSAWISSSCCGAPRHGGRSPRESCSRTGDIVEHGEEAEAAALEGGDAVADGADERRLARDRQPARGVAMNHLLRSTRADQRRGLDAARRRGTRSASPRRSPAASWSTSPDRTAGRTRRPTWAARARWRRRRVTG